MSFANGLNAAAYVSLIFSWIALLIALLPTLLVTFAFVETRRWQYIVAGLLGGLAGGFCGAASLFVSFWFACQGQVHGCNTAQGDMGLIVTFPLGSLTGCFVALMCMRLFSGFRHPRNWAYWVASQLAIGAAMAMFFARLMA